MVEPPKVVPIRPTVDEDTVACCEALLRRAKAGQIVSIVALCENPDGSRSRHMTGCRDAFAILADLARLIHSHQLRMDKATTEE